MHRTTLKTHRALLVAAALALTTSGALAQAAGGIPGSSNDGALPMPGIDLSGTKQVDPATAEKRREIEQQYRAATRRIPAQAAPTANDPWAGMRGTDDKPAAKPGKTTAKNASKKKAVAQ